MNFICEKNEREASSKAAEIIAEVIKKKPDAVLGLATGSTPLDIYRELIKMYRRGELSFKAVRTLNLDEYVSLPPEHEQSYAHYMRTNLFDKIDILKENTHIPNGIASDLKEECRRYDSLIESLGAIDVQLLGIGHNGHIAFNEPASFFSKSTSLVALSDSTVKANSRFFDSESAVPTWALTMGIGSILKAKRIILAAFGEGKAEILEKALFGQITPNIPASILQLYSGELYICTDESAMSVIKSKHKKAKTSMKP